MQYDPYMRLSAAIIKRAVDDYVADVRKGNEKRAKVTEKFFRSSLCQMLSLGHADYINEQAHKLAQNV